MARYCNPKYSTQFKKVIEDKEISKGTLGSIVRCSNNTIFTFFRTTIDKRKKLKEEMNSIIQSYKVHPIKEGILKIKSINSCNTSHIIITEPVIDSLSNIYNTKFKGFEIYKMFNKFNVFIKYCLDNKIDLSNLKLSDIYLTKNHEIKLLTIKYDTEILHKIKKEKFSDTNNNNKNKNNIIYILGVIMYYLYYNEYPKKNETKFPEQKHFKELLKYCLNYNTKYDFNEYINKTFFHPDIIFPNNSKENIKSFNKYIEYKPKKGYLSPDCDELYFEIKNENESNEIYCIYNSYDKSKICEGKCSEKGIRLYKLKMEQNKNIYIIYFNGFYKEKKFCILKKNANNSFSLIQEINTRIYDLLELSTGDIAIIEYEKIIIYHKNSQDKFNIKLTLDINAGYFFETEENYLGVISQERKILFDIKSFKIIKEIKEINGNGLIYLNEIIKMKSKDKIDVIFHDFFEEEIFNFDETIYCITKKKDGTYLVGGKKNNIYQIYFDKYGFVELITKVDTGYGIKEDDCVGDCIYSCGPSEYYGVNFIEECENGNILTISKIDGIRKVWKLYN